MSTSPSQARKFVARHFRISGKSSEKKRAESEGVGSSYQTTSALQLSTPTAFQQNEPANYTFGDAGERKMFAKQRQRMNQNGNWLLVKNQFLGPPSEHKTRSLKASKARVWRALIAEFFGTCLFVFFATGAVVVALSYDPTAGPLANLIVAFTQAFALSIGIYYAANTSGGHLNPVVTLSFVLVGRMRLLVAMLYWVFQIAGAIVASCFLRAVIPDNFEGVLGATTLAPGYGRGSAVLLEAIMTFTLVSIIYATAIDKIGFGKAAPYAIGLTIFLDLIIGWRFTGASMNPARTLGPAVVSGEFSSHWVYWVGPIIGSVVAALIYDFIIISRPANKNPFSAGTRMETEGRPVIAVPAPVAPAVSDSLSDVGGTKGTAPVPGSSAPTGLNAV